MKDFRNQYMGTGICDPETGIILGMGSASERRHYIVTLSVISWGHNQNDPEKLGGSTD